MLDAKDRKIQHLESRLVDKEFLIELYRERCEAQKEQINALESRISAMQNVTTPYMPVHCSHLKLQKGGLSC